MGTAPIGNISRGCAQVVTMDIGAPNSPSGGFDNLESGVPDMRGVRALVLVGGRPDEERFGEFPLALLDVLGRSVLMRTLDRIREAGIDSIAVLSDTQPLPSYPSSAPCKFNVAPRDRFWEESLHKFRHLSRQSECVLVVRLGAWTEVDFAEMVHEYRCSGAALMRACSMDGEVLDVFVISSSGQSEAAALLRGELRDERVGAAEHSTSGYVNLLTTPEDMRTLTLDAFAGESEIRPWGTELRPGVWVGTDARIHRRARIVAPAFVGAFCNVRRAAVVTRGSSIEHHSEVDCASVIDNSSLMPFTRIGVGLDVECSVVGFQTVHSLQRHATVEIDDPLLIGATTNYLSARLLTAANWLITCLQSILLKPLFARKAEETEPEPEPHASIPTLSDAPLATAKSQPKSYREMAATRRYGNQ
jgi:NDP-sugar pyrophosphorylase family protein